MCDQPEISKAAANLVAEPYPCFRSSVLHSLFVHLHVNRGFTCVGSPDGCYCREPEASP